MPDPIESPQTSPRWRWLDHWFEPPLRALITWAALSALMGCLNGFALLGMLAEGTESYYSRLNRLLPTPLPLVFGSITTNASMLFLMFWFEPLALRLNLGRGLCWLGLRIAPYLLGNVYYGSYSQLLGAFPILLSSLLAVGVLWGWRSRPWMAVVGGILNAGLFYIFSMSHVGSWAWVWPVAMSFPYAPVLLYGTRRLPR